MTGIIRRILPLVVFCVLFGHVAAQDAQINLMQINAEKLRADLKFLVKLGDEAQWQNVKDTFEIFADGVDRKKPLRIDVLLGGEGTRFRSCFPFLDATACPPPRGFKLCFFSNLDGFGITKTLKEKDFFEITDGVDFNGFLRQLPEYMLISEKKRDIPADFPDPQLALRPLVDKGYDVAAQMRNTTDTAEVRRKAMQQVRKEALALVKRRTGESPENFELRKTLAEQQLDEAERFVVESDHFVLGWFTDADKKEGRMELELAALPDTSLLKSIQILAEKPSRFAGVPRSEKSILSVRINHPLDEMRQGHLLALFKQLQEVVALRVDDATTLDESQKEAAKSASEMMRDMLIAGTNMGTVDGVIEVVEQAKGQHTLVAGIHSPDGKQFTNIVELLPKIRPGIEVQPKKESAGEIEIHEVTVPPDLRPHLQEFFGGLSTGFVATGPESVWFAAGPNALESLKAAIEKSADAGEGTAAAEFVDISATFGPWIQLLQNTRGEKGQTNFRQMAIDAFAGGQGTMTFKLMRVEDHVEGTGHVDEGTLRFVGKAIAWFSANNL